MHLGSLRPPGIDRDLLVERIVVMTPPFAPRKRFALLCVLALTAVMLSAARNHRPSRYPRRRWSRRIRSMDAEHHEREGRSDRAGREPDDAAGTFTQAQNAGSTATVTRNRILAFNATTGVIDTAFNPNVNGEITSMVVAPGGTAVIIAGSSRRSAERPRRGSRN